MKDSNFSTYIKQDSNCVVIVAHPDDETLWCGGLMLMHPKVQWKVITLCRRSDKDRFSKFHEVIKKYGAIGIMGDLNDGPEQIPLDFCEVQCAIIDLLPTESYDLIITHSPAGEYTRHRRHEEVGEAVTSLWKDKKLFSKELWQFAYEDNRRRSIPQPIKYADLKIKLSKEIWQAKYEIITDVYGFAQNRFEARAVTHQEAFWCFKAAS